MEQVIISIYITFEEFRAEENIPSERITPDRITHWINQFYNYFIIPILMELDNIFKNIYCSKSKVKKFLDQVIQILTKNFNFKIAYKLLKNLDFLNLHPKGKSQRVMLRLFDKLIQEKYALHIIYQF